MKAKDALERRLAKVDLTTRMDAIKEVCADDPKMLSILRDDNLTPDQKLMELKPYLPAAIDRVKLQRDSAMKEIQTTEMNIEMLKASKAVAKWALRDDLRLELNDCSRLHRLVDAATKGMVLDIPDGDAMPTPQTYGGNLTTLQGAQVFVVRHDWAKLVDRSEGDGTAGNVVKLPAPICAFEFRISGRNVVVLASDIGEEPVWTALAEEGDWWVCYICEEAQNGFEMAISQAKAVCVVLDAAVATHEITRAPWKLNKKREAQGRCPLYSFHTVDLERRRKALPPAEGYQESGHHKRLHFCRGHWRHLSGERRVWIRWCLKGNPDLGFVDKEYSL